MSPRIKRPRKVLNPPVIKGFKPYGPETARLHTEPVILLYEEYEALRLCDYDMFNHHCASGIMNVSRPTYTRIYASARQKVAKAFVEGRTISIEGGKVYFDSDWYHCEICRCYFNNPKKEEAVESCPLCGSRRVREFDYNNNHIGTEDNLPDDFCLCPNCGYEQVHQHGIPCKREICPECNSVMKRKGTMNYRNK